MEEEVKRKKKCRRNVEKRKIGVFERSQKKLKFDTTCVRMHITDHLGNAKMSKKAPRFVKFYYFMKRDRRKRFSQNERRMADLPKIASKFLILAGD